MSKLIFTVEPIDDKTCNVKIEATKGISRKLAYKMTEALEANMYRMIDGAFPEKNKGGKNGKN
jgi:hypothetical protein